MEVILKMEAYYGSEIIREHKLISFRESSNNKNNKTRPKNINSHNGTEWRQLELPFLDS